MAFDRHALQIVLLLGIPTSLVAGQPRANLEFGFDGDIPRYWYENDPFKTRFFDAMSTTFPEGERFFIECVRDYRDQVTDPALQQAISQLTAPIPSTSARKPTRIPINFQLGDRLIDSATIRPSTFQSFADCLGAAHRMTQPPAFSARLLRVRMSRQVAYHINGTADLLDAGTGAAAAGAGFLQNRRRSRWRRRQGRQDHPRRRRYQSSHHL